MSLDNDFLKIKASSPELEKKIHINIKDTREKVHWYIMFNLILDEDSINEQSTFVTDRDGVVLSTEIVYRGDKKHIRISPLEDYIEGVYYILNITKEVRSSNHQNLKNDVHILFKIKENRIEDYIILPPNVVVPEPKFLKRREVGAKNKQESKKESNSKVYSFSKFTDGHDVADSLPLAEIRFNPIIGGLGIVLTFGSLFLNNFLIMGVCGGIALVGLAHIIYQLTRAKVRSDFAYNKGVRRFNAGKYSQAEKCFDKALRISSDNEYAEYAKSKIVYYKE